MMLVYVNRVGGFVCSRIPPLLAGTAADCVFFAFAKIALRY